VLNIPLAVACGLLSFGVFVILALVIGARELEDKEAQR